MYVEVKTTTTTITKNNLYIPNTIAQLNVSSLAKYSGRSNYTIMMMPSG